MKIAFIGLGNMGPMAANLLKAGHEVAGFDLVAASMAAARGERRPRHGSVADAVGGADVVVTMLPAGRHVARWCRRFSPPCTANRC